MDDGFGAEQHVAWMKAGFNSAGGDFTPPISESITSCPACNQKYKLALSWQLAEKCRFRRRRMMDNRASLISMSSRAWACQTF